jgi:chemotaxis protein methyltransferase CheR
MVCSFVGLSGTTPISRPVGPGYNEHVEYRTPRPPLAPPPTTAAALAVDQDGYDRLTRNVRTLLGFDLAQYKAPQVWRRVNGFATARGFADVPALLARCRLDPELKAAFRDMITINVSEFFRNPEAWEALRTRYLPSVLHATGINRVWSAGCSLGYEPYTIAMLAREHAAGLTVRILATDLDETILAQARASRYTELQMAGVSAGRRGRFFHQNAGHWEVRPELRALVTFRRHDLLRDPYESGFDLIACRNVVIYFTEDAKARLYERFARSLRPGGLLLVGATEAIANARTVGLEAGAPGFYRRAA